MTEVIYKNKFYIFLVVSYISFLLIKNGIKMFATQDFYAAIVLTVQAMVLYQIYLKHRYVKLGIKTWTFFPFIKEGTLLVIDFLYWVSGGSNNIDPDSTVKSALFFLAAIVIHFTCDRYIKTVERDFV